MTDGIMTYKSRVVSTFDWKLNYMFGLSLDYEIKLEKLNLGLYSKVAVRHNDKIDYVFVVDNWFSHSGYYTTT